MKKFLKKNGLYVLIFVILFGIFIYNLYGYKSNLNQIIKSNTEFVEECKTKNNLSENEQSLCDYAENEALVEQFKEKVNFYSMFCWSYTDGYYKIAFLIFLFVTLPSILYLCRIFKNNMFKNYLTREGYKKTFYKLFFEAHKSSLILPILTIVAMIICFFLTGNFYYKYANTFWEVSTMRNPVLFIIVYLLKMLFISIIYVNITLVVCRKNHRFISATIISYLLFLVIDIFLEVFVNIVIFSMIFKSNFGIVFNIISPFSLFDYYGLFYSFLIPFILMLISCFAVYLCYKNKEKLIIECEKNA